LRIACTLGRKAASTVSVFIVCSFLWLSLAVLSVVYRKRTTFAVRLKLVHTQNGVNTNACPCQREAQPELPAVMATGAGSSASSGEAGTDGAMTSSTTPPSSEAS
jgi:hypothetical protein